MNDLQTLRAALTPDDPSPDVVDRSRHRLQNRMRGEPASRKRTGWLTVGTGLTVAAAAAAVAVAITPATPVEGPPATTVDGSPAKPADAQEILLAAATAAERSPDGSGEYWHVTVTVGDGGPSNVYETWVKPDGRWWFRGEKTQGAVTPMALTKPNPFSLAAVDLTLDQLRALPTDPGALTAWIAEALKRSDARTSAGPLTASDRELFTLHSLISLVSELPAPPAVRAAAFRAITAYPGVTSLGEVPGGQGLLLPGGHRVVVDPSTGRVNGTSVFVTMDGALFGTPDPNGARINAEWTNTLPA